MAIRGNRSQTYAAQGPTGSSSRAQGSPTNRVSEEVEKATFIAFHSPTRYLSPVGAPGDEIRPASWRWKRSEPKGSDRIRSCGHEVRKRQTSKSSLAEVRDRLPIVLVPRGC